VELVFLEPVCSDQKDSCAQNEGTMTREQLISKLEKAHDRSKKNLENLKRTNAAHSLDSLIRMEEEAVAAYKSTIKLLKLPA